MRKIGLALAVSLMLCNAASAQQDYNLKLKGTDVEMLGEGLGKLPYEKVAPLINNIRQQIVDQQIKPAPVNPPVEPKKD